MRKALGLPVQRARSWYRRYGRLAGPQTSRPVVSGPHVARGRTLEDWARLGGGLLTPESADAPPAESRAPTERRSSAASISPTG